MHRAWASTTSRPGTPSRIDRCCGSMRRWASPSSPRGSPWRFISGTREAASYRAEQMACRLRIYRYMKVRVVSRDGYRLRVTTWGSGGPHVIVLPGLSADARSLAPQIRAIRRLAGSTHVVDLPGSALGPALRRSDASFAKLARYVAAVADELGIGHALIV